MCYFVIYNTTYLINKKIHDQHITCKIYKYEYIYIYMKSHIYIFTLEKVHSVHMYLCVCNFVYIFGG